MGKQRDVLKQCIAFYRSRRKIVETFIWQFADCRVTDEANWFQTRLGTRNNKGVASRYRRLKLAFETGKDNYRQ